MFIRISGALLLLAALAVTLPAQDDPPPADAPAESPPADAPADDAPAEDAPAADAPAAGETVTADDFDPLFAEWKEILKELRALQREFLNASPERKQELRAAWDETYGRGLEMAPRLQAAGEAAYLADPDNRDIADFLASSALGNATEDNYEESLRLAEMLIDHEYANQEIHAVAAFAAYRSMAFERARKHLEAAEGNSFQQELAMARQEIDQLQADWEKEEAIRAKEAEADDLPRVLFETSKGNITLELFENEAPNTVANMISLVEKGFYDGIVFHRVLPGFMAQGGDPTGTGSGGPGYYIPCECYEENARLHFRGSLSMAHAGRNTGGSQFFLTFHPTTHLNGKHTVFGRVIDGMGVLSKLKRRDPEAEADVEPDKIIKATVVRKRDHEYTPQTLAER